jgi:predicted trehalose synthase
MTPTTLAAARWFRAKQHEVADVTEIDRAPLTPTADLVMVEVSYRDTSQRDRYLLLLTAGREPADGDGAWRALAAAMRDERSVEGSRGRFVGRWTGVIALDANDVERLLKVEQSNTSVVIGERLILKLYRLVEAGDNPDLEISAFLTDAGFADTPALAGSIGRRCLGGHARRVSVDASCGRRDGAVDRGRHGGAACDAGFASGRPRVPRATGDRGRDRGVARVGRAAACPGGRRGQR